MRIEPGKLYRTLGGDKVGPMKPDLGEWEASPWTTDGTGRLWMIDSGIRYRAGTYEGSNLIAEWSDGPVRTETVTRKVIVPGTYGRVRVTGTYKATNVTFEFTGGEYVTTDVDVVGLNASDFRAAAATFIELAEALEQDK